MTIRKKYLSRNIATIVNFKCIGSPDTRTLIYIVSTHINVKIRFDGYVKSRVKRTIRHGINNVKGKLFHPFAT